MRNKMNGSHFGIMPSFEVEGGGGGDGGETVVKEGSASAAEEFQDAPEGEEASPSSDSNESGGETPKTFTQEQVSEIVSKRVNDMKEKGEAWGKLGTNPEEVAEKLKRLDGFESVAKGGSPELKPIDPQEQQFRTYMEKLYPGLGEIGKSSERIKALEGGMEGMSKAEFQRHAKTGSESIANMAKEIGIEGKRVEFVENMVTTLIGQDPEAVKRFQSGDQTVVKEKFDIVHKEFLDSFISDGVKAQAKVRGKTAALPPKMPPGGVPAPTSKAKSMNDRERSAKGFEMYSDAGGTT